MSNSYNNLPQFAYKVVVMGDATVGKDVLIKKFCRNCFQDMSESTVGAAYVTKQIQVSDAIIKYEIWDTAGQEKYASLAPMYYRGAACALVVYDITNTHTFQRAQKWVGDLKQSGAKGVVIALVGNNSDQSDLRQVHAVDAQIFADQEQIMFLEVSAKTGDRVEELFVTLGNKLPRTRPGTFLDHVAIPDVREGSKGDLKAVAKRHEAEVRAAEETLAKNPVLRQQLSALEIELEAQTRRAAAVAAELTASKTALVELQTEVRTIKTEWENDVGQVRTRMMNLDLENMNLTEANSELQQKVIEMEKELHCVTNFSQTTVEDLKTQLSNQAEAEKQLTSIKCRCLKCRSTFLSIDELKEHDQVCDNVTKFICPICEMIMTSLDFLITHLDSHNDRANSLRLSTQCKNYGNNFGTAHEMDQHERECKVKEKENDQKQTLQQETDEKQLQNLQQQNQSLVAENSRLSATAEQLTQQLQQPTGQPNQLQVQQLQGQLASQQQQNSLLARDLEQIRTKQEVETLRNQLQLNSETNRLKDEIIQLERQATRFEKELTKSQAELVYAKSSKLNSCRRCDAQFVDAVDLADHEKTCKKLPCPLCDMKFRQLDQFYEHVGSHMKRDSAGSE